MPAWISRSMKILSSILMLTFSTLAFLFIVIYTLVTGWTFMKGALVIGLFILSVISYVILSRKIYNYLFGPWGEDE
ncbi:hypothetical protein [Halobacillus litoralis]|uniref:hypothetical protein n=1 Tax=Halobacillus litoralis TaxID=45668 RepID=UPI001CFC4AC9|nr:hypothetical protein [Halobacillus litoralis]